MSVGERPRLVEVVVVEGKRDVDAVLRAVDAVVITTGGCGFTEATLDAIRAAADACGVVVLTDPDPAGEYIRRSIANAVSGVKHAHLAREGAANNEGRMGVEYARPERIWRALATAHVEAERDVVCASFSLVDLHARGLAGTADAAERRLVLAERLGMGPVRSARVFLERLNRYGIAREDFERYSAGG